MSTLLTMARAVKRESGLGAGGSDPASFATATGDDLRFFHWIIAAWRDIDLMHEAWSWRRGTGTAVTNGTRVLSPTADFGLADHASWLTPTREYRPSAYKTADGAVAETFLTWLPYDDFRSRYIVGTHTASGLAHWSIDPSTNAMLVGPTPDAQHTVRADYIKDHVALAADADVPALPSRFHSLIEWRALKEYAGFDAASEVWQRAEANYRSLFPALSQACLPRMRWGGRPLA